MNILPPKLPWTPPAGGLLCTYCCVVSATAHQGGMVHAVLARRRAGDVTQLPLFRTLPV